jgi:hypothetical protein
MAAAEHPLALLYSPEITVFPPLWLLTAFAGSVLPEGRLRRAWELTFFPGGLGALATLLVATGLHWNTRHITMFRFAILDVLLADVAGVIVAVVLTFFAWLSGARAAPRMALAGLVLALAICVRCAWGLIERGGV